MEKSSSWRRDRHSYNHIGNCECMLYIFPCLLFFPGVEGWVGPPTGHVCVWEGAIPECHSVFPLHLWTQSTWQLLPWRDVNQSSVMGNQLTSKHGRQPTSCISFVKLGRDLATASFADYESATGKKMKGVSSTYSELMVVGLRSFKFWEGGSDQALRIMMKGLEFLPVEERHVWKHTHTHTHAHTLHIFSWSLVMDSSVRSYYVGTFLELCILISFQRAEMLCNNLHSAKISDVFFFFFPLNKLYFFTTVLGS